MAGGSANTSSVQVEHEGNQKYGFPIAIMSTLFFLVGFITVLNDILIPILETVFDFKENETWKLMLIQFCFFTAYGVMSVPGGMLIKNIGYKKGTIYSLLIVAVGIFLIYPATIFMSYPLVLLALFIVGNGFAILQVSINPYLIALGSPETGASRLNLGGALNSTATFIGPIFGAFVLLSTCLSNPEDKIAKLQIPYLMFGGIIFLIAILLIFTKLPKLSMENEEGEKLEGSLFDFKHLFYGAGAIFFYVGAEVVIGSLMGKYFKSEAMGSLKENEAIFLIAYYWGGAMIGRFAGSNITKKIAPNKALSFVAIGAFVLIGLSMMGFMLDTKISIPIMEKIENCDTNTSEFIFRSVQLPLAGLCLILVGLFNSIMWPTIFPLGTAGLGKWTSKGSGLMVTMVAGGAFISLFQGYLADQIGLRFSFVTCLVCYAYIYFFASKGYKAK